MSHEFKPGEKVIYRKRTHLLVRRKDGPGYVEKPPHEGEVEFLATTDREHGFA